jgi:hypothetical protein
MQKHFQTIQQLILKLVDKACFAIKNSFLQYTNTAYFKK